MSFSMTPLLLHRDDVPASVRQALLAANDEPADRRTPYLESAASILHRELDLDCVDARELVGLSTPGGCC
jgi:hypothetical protein